EFIHLLPRIAIGVVGSGYIAEVLPKALIAPWLGPESGLTGVIIATLGGALTPGGPVVSFSIDAAAHCLAARGGVTAAAIHRGGRGHGVGEAVIGSNPGFKPG